MLRSYLPGYLPAQKAKKFLLTLPESFQAGTKTFKTMDQVVEHLRTEDTYMPSGGRAVKYHLTTVAGPEECRKQPRASD